MALNWPTIVFLPAWHWFTALSGQIGHYSVHCSCRNQISQYVYPYLSLFFNYTSLKNLNTLFFLTIRSWWSCSYVFLWLYYLLLGVYICNNSKFINDLNFIRPLNNQCYIYVQNCGTLVKKDNKLNSKAETKVYFIGLKRPLNMLHSSQKFVDITQFQHS